MNHLLIKDCESILNRVDLSAFSGKTVIIVGSNGLIGSQLARAFFWSNKTKGTDIRVLGVSRGEPNLLLQDTLADKRFSYRAQDLSVDYSIPEKADFIVHCATYAQPKKFLSDGLGTIKLNTELTEALLRKCEKERAAFLFASSSDVYGAPDAAHIPTPETYNGNLSTTAPRSIYGESKRLGETFCSFFRANRNVDAKIARISMVYGPGISVHDDRVMGHFLRKALLNGHVEMLDPGLQIRTWCYITDCAVMLLKIMLSGKEYVYNVGGRDEKSIRGLAELICELTGATSAAPPTPAAAGQLAAGADRVALDLTKITTEFGIRDFVPMQTGMANVVQWNKEEILPQPAGKN